MRVRKFLDERMAEVGGKSENWFLKNAHNDRQDNSLDLWMVSRLISDVDYDDSEITKYLLGNIWKNSPGFLSVWLCMEKIIKAGKNYLFSEPLLKDLIRADLGKLRMSDIPRGCGCVQLPFALQDITGGNFNEFLFFVGSASDYYSDPTLEGEVMSMCWFDGGEIGFHCYRFDDSDELVSDFMRRENKKIVVAQPDLSMEINDVSDGYGQGTREFFSMLAYIGSGRPDMREEKNEITYRNGGKVVAKDRHLSEKEYIHVGYGYKKPPNYSKSMWYSQPYFRLFNGQSQYVRGSIKKRKD